MVGEIAVPRKCRGTVTASKEMRNRLIQEGRGRWNRKMRSRTKYIIEYLIEFSQSERRWLRLGGGGSEGNLVARDDGVTVHLLDIRVSAHDLLYHALVDWLQRSSSWPNLQGL